MNARKILLGLAFVALLGGLLGLGGLVCGLGVTESTGGAGGPGRGGPVVVVYTPRPTATAWPTFTPVPTETPVPTRVPRRTLTPTPTPESVGAGGPLDDGPVSGGEDGVGVEETAVPGPTPYGQLYRGGVKLVRQTFFPLLSTELPDYLRERNLEALPPSEEVVNSGIPFVMWGVFFDVLAAEEGFEMEGLVRWVQLGGDFGDVVMYESPVTIKKEEPFFYSGLGEESGRLWKRGQYRVEFLDDRGYRTVSWRFRVR